MIGNNFLNEHCNPFIGYKKSSSIKATLESKLLQIHLSSVSNQPYFSIQLI